MLLELLVFTFEVVSVNLNYPLCVGMLIVWSKLLAEDGVMTAEIVPGLWLSLKNTSQILGLLQSRQSSLDDKLKYLQQCFWFFEVDS